MGWRFWRREKTAAELSLERLRAASDRPAPSAGAPQQAWDAEAPFTMTVEDVFAITGRGTVVTGRVAAGTVRVGQPVEISGEQGAVATEVTGIEMFRALREEARAGENVGLLLRGVERRQVARGDVVREAR